MWKGLITPASFAHPAKFSRRLVERILDNMADQGWLNPGDVIGDPFGGVGCGGIVAAYRGYRWIGVELEPKFVELAECNFKKHESKWLGVILTYPVPVMIRGDSREFDQHVHAILTSPPYVSGGHHTDVFHGGNKEKRRGQGILEGYGKSAGQIAVLENGSADAVITSPPYEDSINSKSHGIDFSKSKKDYPGRVNHPERNQAHAAAADNMIYGQAQGQIGSEKGETYWQAMAKVYHACLKSLKPGGVMAIVVKDFVRDKKRMPFCDDTMRLLAWLGFEEIERVQAMLTEERTENDLFDGTRTKKTERKSFFRRLHESRLAPDDPRRIDYEEVLFVRKP